MGKASTRAQNKYIAKAYDRINLTVPKGQKAAIEAHIKGKAPSLTSYINGLIRADMGLTEAQWKQGD